MQVNSLDFTATKEIHLDSELGSPEEEKVTLTVRTCLSKRERDFLVKALTEDISQYPTHCANIVLMGTKGIYEANGDDFILRRESKKIHGFIKALSRDTLDKLPPIILHEVGEYCTGEFFQYLLNAGQKSELSEEDVKN